MCKDTDIRDRIADTYTFYRELTPTSTAAGTVMEPPREVSSEREDPTPRLGVALRRTPQGMILFPQALLPFQYTPP